MEADSNYTHIFMVGNKKITSAKTLKEYEDLLFSKPFFRIHHAHLVNLRHIEKYIKGEGGYVVTSDQTTLEVSRRRKAELLEAFSKI
jgi:two-component system LytT family response regulator